MFSVVITTKNRELFLLRALKSALCNTILPNDIVIVNDGGKVPDLSSLELSGVKITLINNETSKGANYCRNVGISACAAEYVFLLDDDDAFTQDSFSNRLSVIKEDKSIGACFTGIKIVRSSSLDEVIREVLPSTPKCGNYLFVLLHSGNVLGSTSRVVLRKSFFHMVGGFDEDLSCMQDYDLWIRLSKVSNFRHDKQTNILYTVHDDGNQISSKHKNYLTVGFQLLDKYQEDIKKLGLTREFLSNVYLRVAISAAPSSFKNKTLYALKSFYNKPNLKSAILLFFPFFILKKIYTFA